MPNPAGGDAEGEMIQMKAVNIHEAKRHLSRLVDQAAKGEPFVIAKAGKPLVKVMSLDTPVGGKDRRLGFMKGRILVPDDFDRMGNAEVERLFGGDA
jgi:prevent-host-death family protein